MNKWFEPAQMKALLIAHSKELIRQPELLFWGVLFPILLTLGLGLAFTQKHDVVHRIAVIETSDSSSKLAGFLRQRTEKAKEDDVYVNKLTIKDAKLGNTIYIFRNMNWQEANTLLKRGDISLVLDEKNREVQYHFDPLNPDAQLAYLKLSRILSGHSSNVAAGQASDKIEPLTLQGTRYVDFLVPGLIAMGIMMSSVWGLSYSIIDKRSKKLLRRMVATPMKKSHYLLSLMAVRMAMNLIEAGLLYIFAHFFFNVNIEGSVSALILIFLAANLAFEGISVFISSRTYSTEVGNGLINAVTTPMMILSGIFFSYHNFPAWAVVFIKILPLTILADSMRSIFIEGAGYYQVAMPFLVLLAIGIVFFTLGLRMFRWH